MLSWAGMLGLTWDSGRIRALGAGPLLAALAYVGGCSVSSSSGTSVENPGFGSGGSNSSDPPPSVGPSTGGAVSVGGKAGGPGSQLSCSVAVVPAPVFGTQRVSAAAPAPALGEFYTWTTDEQAAALRTDQVLFPQAQQPNFMIPSLQQLSFSPNAAVAQLATALGGDLFASGRVAWSEPWAVRTTFNGEDPGKNLLRIVLKPEAWVAIVKGGTLEVVDLQNQPVTVEDAAATPARLGAIFHQHDLSDGGPDCNQIPNGMVGFRDFIVGNLAMVQEWSMGTQVIRDRLSANVDLLTQFFNRTRACPNEVTQQFWNQDVVCSWDTPLFDGDVTEAFAYEQALAFPNALYATSPPDLAALITKLQGDLFEPEPLVVTPGSP